MSILIRSMLGFCYPNLLLSFTSYLFLFLDENMNFFVHELFRVASLMFFESACHIVLRVLSNKSYLQVQMTKGSKELNAIVSRTLAFN